MLADRIEVLRPVELSMQPPETPAEGYESMLISLPWSVDTDGVEDLLPQLEVRKPLDGAVTQG